MKRVSLPFRKNLVTSSSQPTVFNSSGPSESLDDMESLTIVKEHMMFIVGLLVAPDFKRMINWLTLDS